MHKREERALRGGVVRGPLDERLWFLADWDFWLELAGAGGTVYCPRPLAGFRVHRGSQTMSAPERLADFAGQYDIVLARHFARWEGRLPELAAVRRVARFSADVNVAFARWASGERAHLTRLAWRLLWLGPAGWRRYGRDSRILERVVARLRAGVLPPRGDHGAVVPASAVRHAAVHETCADR